MAVCKGSISSFLSLGGTDGPGIRSVVFMQGCPIRCSYCHNPETWEFKEADTELSALVNKIERFMPYYKSGGGVTVSGGEPLCQQEFVTALFEILKEKGIHSCLDTSAQVPVEDSLLNCTDLVLCDVKFLSEEEYHLHTKGSFQKVLDFLEKCQKKSVPVWIRHVLVPDVTDNEDYVKSLALFCKNYSVIERIDLLPFKNLCQSKYDELGLPFPMEKAEPVSSQRAKDLEKYLQTK